MCVFAALRWPRRRRQRSSSSYYSPIAPSLLFLYIADTKLFPRACTHTHRRIHLYVSSLPNRRRPPLACSFARSLSAVFLPTHSLTHPPHPISQPTQPIPFYRWLTGLPRSALRASAFGVFPLSRFPLSFSFLLLLLLLLLLLVLLSTIVLAVRVSVCVCRSLSLSLSSFHPSHSQAFHTHREGREGGERAGGGHGSRRDEREREYDGRICALQPYIISKSQAE